MNSDLQLKEQVLSRLELEPKIDVGAVGVSVEDGVVTLRGSVETENDRVSTERVVRELRGVKGVKDDELRVKSQLCTRPSDAELQAAACEAMDWLTTVQHENVQVTARNAWLVLEGEADSIHQARNLEGVMREIPGVCGVENRLQIKAAHCQEA